MHWAAAFWLTRVLVDLKPPGLLLEGARGDERTLS
jgi:hypothetical protein